LSTGQFIDAARAVELSLANRAVPAESLQANTRFLAQSAAAKLSAAERSGKRAFYEQAQINLATAYAHIGQVMDANKLLRDTDDGITAFLEKRYPDWA
jgi:enoyl-CoA hydratase/carnithine racemase